MDVRINPAGRDNFSLGGQHLRTRPDLHALRDTVHQIGIPGFADPGNPSVTNPDVGLHDTPPVDDDGIGNDEIQRPLLPGSSR